MRRDLRGLWTHRSAAARPLTVRIAGLVWVEGVVRGSTAAGAMPAALVRAALARGSRDNCTAIIAKYVRD